MNSYEGKEFVKLRDRDSGAVIEDIVLVNCVFDNCSVSLTRSIELRSTIRNVRLTNCVSVNCGIGPAVFEDVTLDGLETNDLLIAWGPLFKHVILKGKIGKVKINLTANFWDPRSEMQRPFDLARSKFYEKVDWALDIADAQFAEFEMSGVPAKLVRRDPATQIKVTRERALRSDWRERLSPTNTYWPMVIDLFLQDGQPDVVLVAPKRKPKRIFKSLLEGLDELRRLEVAEPD